MRPMRAGKTPPPRIAITTSDDPRFVYGPRWRMLSAKIVGNMIEWKKPSSTIPANAGAPLVKITSKTDATLPIANAANMCAGRIFLIRADPANRPIMNPSRCSFR